mgnify:CR=1 FL=1
MPVFDFSDTPKKEEEPQCTYTVYCSNEPAASPEKPMLVLDNSSRAWKHHSCGVFTNQAKRTAFEFKEEDGTVRADILQVDARFTSLLRWLGENHISVRLSGQNRGDGYAVYKIREVAFGGGTKLSAEDGFLQFMIERLLASSAPAEELEKAFQPNTKAVFAETISNPAGVVLDIDKFVKLAHEHGVPMICDNTFATPINCRPFEFGVDIVTHSTTKYMDGHAMALGGAIVDSGNFDWDAHADKFPGLTTPDESYHGVIYTQKFGKKAYITKATAQLMRDMGACQSPQNAFLTNVGLETLHLRVERHCRNAEKVAEFLKNHPKVAWVEYAGLADSKYHALAEKYMPNGTCGVLCFGPKGGRDGAMRFTNGLKMVAIVTHVADARSCVLHPASHTHRQLNDQQLIEAGVLPDLIRLSVGIEDVNDIIADIDQALANV